MNCVVYGDLKIVKYEVRPVNSELPTMQCK